MARRLVTEPRWVGARSRSGYVLHAVWITHNTEPGEKRDGHAKCGARVIIQSVGDQGGLDWERLTRDQTCLNCRREMSRADPLAQV